ncbi:hypothetical protein [Jannaschia sp. CCS1]|uniref:hypothetical protein n=1 Tax=Jannaschia sp. (strain CCS1) TaxID=290400 RepID=UPI00006C0107|nr:hypothetical protein [Jannaschia sp. CCS1]ABD56925.1 hypothetical protein Jann_4008 [Jannaschia sp. CCS1]
MGDLRLILLAIAVAAPAQAQVSDAFAQFEARCLTPMLEVRDSDTDGLILMVDGVDEQMWMAHFRDWQLVRSTSDAVVQFCSVFGVFGPEVAAWADAEVASGNWIRIDRTPETLQSTFQREPLIEVEIDRDASPMGLTVVETNLES